MKGFRRIIAFLLLVTVVAGFYIPVHAATGSYEGWYVGYRGGVKADWGLDNDIYHTGNTSLRIKKYGILESNVYIDFYARVTLEKGKKYQYGFWMKAKNISSVQSCMNWESRVNLDAVSSTYDWKYFTFDYEATMSGTNEFRILIGGPSTIWLDDFEYHEIKEDGTKGPNMFNNPGLEGVGVVSTGSSNNSNEFSVEDFYNTLSTAKTIPVYKADNIVIDGSIDDWENTTTINNLPSVDKIHVQNYTNVPVDAKVDMSFAYDEDYLYFLTVAEDDIHYEQEGSEYWRGDSIQLGLSKKGENYGAEIGYIYTPDENGGKYSLDYGTSEMDGLLLKTVRHGNKTYYESAIPWNLYYGEFMDEILFSALYNDNDNDLRKYAIQLAPGIAEGKLNAQFPTLLMMPENVKFFGWCEGPDSGEVFEKYTYSISVLNSTDKNNDYMITVGEETKTVKIPAQKGVKTAFDVEFDVPGKQELPITIVCGEGKQEINYSVSLVGAPDYYDESILALEKKAEEIENLIAQCNEKGISTDYEEPVAFILGRWCEYIRKDAAQKYYDIMEYTFDELEEMYIEAKENLNAYLSGEKTSVDTPEYVTSDVENDGITQWAETEWFDGKKERRPVFLIGFVGEDYQRDVKNFQNLGFNALQFQLGIYNVIREQQWRPGWGGRNGGANVQFTTVTDKSIVPSGNNCLKMTCTSTGGTKTLLQFVENIEPNTTYEFGGKIKTKNAKGVWMSAIDNPTADNKHQLEGTYDWKEVKFEYTPDMSDVRLEFQIVVNNIAEEILVDDLFVRKKGSKTNLLKNPGFEEKYELWNDFAIHTSSWDYALDVLETAEENNVAVDFLLAPRYVLDVYFTDEVEKNLSGDARVMNVKGETMMKFMEKYLDTILPEMAKYKSLNSICIANEPTLDTQQNEAYFHDDFIAYLREVYNDDLDEYNRINNTSWKDFDEIKMPTGTNPSVLLYDWKVFNDLQSYKWTTWMRNKIREYLPDVKISTKIMQPIFEDDSALRVHIRYGSNYELYANVSDVNGSDAFNYYSPTKQPQILGYNTNPLTTNALEESFWYDTQVSYKYMPTYNTEDHVISDGYPNYIPEIATHVASDVWQSSLHGRGFSALWVWARSYIDGAHTKNSILTRPDALLAASKATLDANRLSYEILALANESPKVGIMWSDTSRMLQEAYLNSVYKTYESTVYSGLKAAVESENVIERIHNYDVFICPSVLNVKKEKLYELLEYAKSDKTLILLGNDCLKYDEHNQPHDEALVAEIHKNAIVIENKLDGSKMTKPDDLRRQLTEVFDKHNLRRVRVVDAESGQDVNMVEFMYTEYQGKLLLNLVLQDWSRNQNVKILIDGKPVTSSLELRSMTEYGEAFELKTCQPILLQIDTDAQMNEKAIKLQINNAVMTIDGKRKVIDSTSHDTVPVIVNDRTLMPVRAIVESIGGEVLWDEQLRQVTLNYDGKELKLTIDNNVAYADGVASILDASPQIMNNRTMLPLRFIAENFGLTVEWNNEGKIVTVTK